jgi:hypothetical protein
MSLLLLFTSLLTAQLVVLSHDLESVKHLGVENIPAMLVPLAAFAGIVTVLNMPFRDPIMPNEDISPVYGKPTVKLRTPEDNLTPWQYSAVTWMAPLIQEGYKRQLDDEDIWDLPWEFKHARLHSTFRDLRGSVTRRIFVANGMDLVRTTSMGFIRLFSSECRALYTSSQGLTDHPSSCDTRSSSAAARFNERREIDRWSDHHICSAQCCTPLAAGAAGRVQSVVSEAFLRTVKRPDDYNAIRKDTESQDPRGQAGREERAIKWP